jgi:hypothetical protein
VSHGELEKAMAIIAAQPVPKPVNPKKVKRCCGTCAYAAFERSESGRIRRNSSARCTFEVRIGPVPICAKVRVERIYVQADTGTDCPTWAACE